MIDGMKALVGKRVERTGVFDNIEMEDESTRITSKIVMIKMITVSASNPYISCLGLPHVSSSRPSTEALREL